ncbi:MAG: UDP-N-acetylmuramate dehydrogenase [Rhodospirillales bacterium]|nr:UDP-N-acetylmuramate dehydrogenase [Rhodospirillales bacterium]
MMAANHQQVHLIETLPPVRGQLKADESLAKYTWFKTGGPAEVLFRPADEDDLCAFLAATPVDVPVMVMGNASNLLVRDGGVPGVVIRLGRGFSSIRVSGQQLDVGAGAADLTVARSARDHGLTGLEFLAGIPGSVGGTVRMNGGAYGSEIKDICSAVHAVDRSGRERRVDARDIGFSYRHSDLDATWVITRAVLTGVAGERDQITSRMQQIQTERELSQPVRTLTGGSTFANPEGHKAWELIAQAGCRGLVRGDASVSNLHCNFLVNAGTATAADIEGLGEDVRRRVFEKSGITLQWEIRIVGNPKPNHIKEIQP